MSDHGDGLPEEVPRYWDTFLDQPPTGPAAADGRVILVPVPYDSTTSYKGGTRHGPKAIIAASRQLEDYDLELDRDISQAGITTTAEIVPDVSGPQAMVGRVARVVGSLAAPGKLIGLLGGEHSITVGAVRALTEVYPSLSVLYLDAHADLRDEYMGTPWGHASVARRLHDLCPIVLAGVRSLSTEERRFIDTAELPVFFWPPSVPDIGELSRRVLERLSDTVYISIDLDVFDPSLMAAVGTPEPGGMGWEQVTGLVRAVAESRQVVGFDITELSPGEGPEACAFTAAKLVYKLIGYATQPDPNGAPGT
jgi:agmatinase